MYEVISLKKSGRCYTPLTNKEIEIVLRFLGNDKSYVEFAKEVGLTVAQLKYRVAKYRKDFGCKKDVVRV